LLIFLIQFLGNTASILQFQQIKSVSKSGTFATTPCSNEIPGVR
jgi:hypothetical protein